MTVKRKPTAERRTEIADAALQIIGTQGIAALTTAKLAQQIGLSSGALFRHFDTREAILEEVARRAEALLRASLPPAELPPSARLDRFLEDRAAVAGQHAGLLRLMLSEQFALAFPAAGKRRLRRAVAETRELVQQTLREGQAAGAFRDDQPAEALSVIVLGTLQMLAFSAALGGGVAGDESKRVRATLRALINREPSAPKRRRS